MSKTCSYCNKKRRVGKFYYEGSLEGEKDICVYCLLPYYEKKGVDKETVEYIKKLNKIQPEQKSILAFNKSNQIKTKSSE
jgi:hypothetical protein